MRLARLLSLIVVASATILFQSVAFAIGAAYSGSWYNPEQSGHGFSLEYTVLNDDTPLVVVYWYVYDTEGNPIFLIGMGEPEEGNTVTVEFEAPYGMKFGEFDPEQTVRGDGGTGVFSFDNPDSGVFDYQPSTWIANTYGVSAITTPVVKILGVAHPNPEVVELLIPGRIATTERRGDFPVCFNGDGELLPCASNDPPPVEDPYSGSWTGRMTYDRNSTDICLDVDVTMQLENTSASGLVGQSDAGIFILPTTFSLNSNGFVSFASRYGSACQTYYKTFCPTGYHTNFTLQFTENGSASGVWSEQNYDCHGTWSFTKD